MTLAQGEYGEDLVFWTTCSELGVRDCVLRFKYLAALTRRTTVLAVGTDLPNHCLHRANWFHFLSGRDEVLLVCEPFVLTEELAFASADCLHSEEHDSPEEFDSHNSDRCCAMRQLSQNIYPPNNHIIEGHLCLIMSGCSLGYKQPPLQPLAGWLLREKQTLVI